MTLSSRLRAGGPYAVFVSVAVLMLWPVVFTGRAFVPSQYLDYAAPWSADVRPDQRVPWNPLMYDSVGQFFPWRSLAAESLRHGVVPLWNPYQFCGTPFLANSQSAPLYPGSALYWIMDPRTAVGWTALLHLIMAASFMYMFARSLGASHAGGALAGIVYAFSSWQISWLHLPTFLDTSCWIPLCLVATRSACRGRVGALVGLGIAGGMMLLAGHLQIAFYGILACALSATVEIASEHRTRGRAASVRGLVCCLAGAVIAGMVALPQLAPSIELARQSHRSGGATSEGYRAYTAYSIHPGGFGSLVAPDLFGNPSDPSRPYVGFSKGKQYFNYAEGAMYCGIGALILASMSLATSGRSRTKWLLGGMGALSALMAAGTPVDALFYFSIPGFGGSGSPGRVMVLFTLSVAVLAGFGLDDVAAATGRRGRLAWAAAGALLLAACAAAVWGRLAAAEIVGAEALSDANLTRQIAVGALFVGAAAAWARSRGRNSKLSWGMVAVIAVDLLAAGANYNPSADPASVFRETAGIRTIRAMAGPDRVMPLNSGWSFGGPSAVLPPNSATALHMRDVQGYDSLFPGRYKAWLARLIGADPSPPEVGNMVFARPPWQRIAAEAGVRVIVGDARLPSDGLRLAHTDGMVVGEVVDAIGRARAVTTSGNAVPVRWMADSPNRVELQVSMPEGGTLVLADQHYPGWQAQIDRTSAPITLWNGVFRQVDLTSGEHTVAFTFAPSSFRVGLYAMMAAAAVMAGTLTLTCTRRRRPSRRSVTAVG